MILNPIAEELNITRQIVFHLNEALDTFISACIDESGNIKAPSAKDIAKVRAYLPKGYKNSYPKAQN
jgi:hypothetical protein